MSKLNQFKQKPRQLLDLDEVLAEIKAEEEVLAEIETEEHKINLCPFRAWCFSKRIGISKRAMAHRHCGFEERDELWQCPAYRKDGHERPLDRGDVMARCVGAEFCGEKDCYHYTLHQWDPARGCRDVHCRDLEAVLERWDEETRGPRPDIDAVITCEMVE